MRNSNNASAPKYGKIGAYATHSNKRTKKPGTNRVDPLPARRHFKHVQDVSTIKSEIENFRKTKYKTPKRNRSRKDLRSLGFNYGYKCHICAHTIFFMKRMPKFNEIIRADDVFLENGKNPKADSPIICPVCNINLATLYVSQVVYL